MIIGFIGLGNLGEKLAATLLRNGLDLIIHDKFKENGSKLITSGAKWEDKPIELAKKSDIIITCLPSPIICAQVMESEIGVIKGFSAGKIWRPVLSSSLLIMDGENAPWPYVDIPSLNISINFGAISSGIFFSSATF